MKKTAETMTEEEKREFEEAFYEVAEFDDRESPCPWGCPWYYAGARVLEGSTPTEMAELYYEDVKEDMALALIDEE